MCLGLGCIPYQDFSQLGVEGLAVWPVRIEDKVFRMSQEKMRWTLHSRQGCLEFCKQFRAMKAHGQRLPSSHCVWKNRRNLSEI